MMAHRSLEVIGIVRRRKKPTRRATRAGNGWDDWVGKLERTKVPREYF